MAITQAFLSQSESTDFGRSFVSTGYCPDCLAAVRDLSAARWVCAEFACGRSISDVEGGGTLAAMAKRKQRSRKSGLSARGNKTGL